ncbi:unnamed protein product [Taenia asiatica]|uniref:Histone H2A n=1 Tax=Taenia asiatica TaxID=60517 RepID=A0A0R3VY37_TAEAS|nr:unnamed protein product [Taenia asiatica]
MHRFLLRGNYAERVSAKALVHLAAVLECSDADTLNLVGFEARGDKKTRIIPLHLQLAIYNDGKLNWFSGGETMS